MRPKSFLRIILILAVSLLALRSDEIVVHVPANWPKPARAVNQLRPDEIALGRLLFYDPILSRDSSISCASCHSPFNAFAHSDHALSHGINDSIGFRNAPSLQLLAWQTTFMWDGAFSSLEQQVLFPIQHPGEMDLDTTEMVSRLNNQERYRKYAQGGQDSGKFTAMRVQQSIASFLLTIISSDTRYDSVKRGEAVFTLQERNGEALFTKNCASCHPPPLFSTFGFARNGLPLHETLRDYGRIRITRNPADSMCFKIPTLRNVEYSSPYMHDGRFQSLSQVVNHYAQGVRLPLGKDSIRITLDARERTDLVAFLLTLSDRKFLTRPDLANPVY